MYKMIIQLALLHVAETTTITKKQEDTDRTRKVCRNPDSSTKKISNFKRRHFLFIDTCYFAWNCM